MKTIIYNPSKLEQDIALAIESLKGEIGKKLIGHEIVEIENKIDEDNPFLVMKIADEDGDLHEVVVKIIQRPDK
jgi:hypothetical protein